MCSGLWYLRALIEPATSVPDGSILKTRSCGQRTLSAAVAVSRWNSVQKGGRMYQKGPQRRGRSRVMVTKAVRMTQSLLHIISIIPPFGSPRWTSWDSIRSFIGNATARLIKIVSHIVIKAKWLCSSIVQKVFGKLSYWPFRAHIVELMLLTLDSTKEYPGMILSVLMPIFEWTYLDWPNPDHFKFKSCCEMWAAKRRNNADNAQNTLCHVYSLHRCHFPLL